MKTVNEVSKLVGVSIRTLQYYDNIGLLHPSHYTEAGYRLYNNTDLERLQQILLFRELDFPLKEIKGLIESPDFNKGKALEQQITLLTLQKERIENLINVARGIKLIGVNYMDFKAFNTSKIDEYTTKAKESWRNVPEYKEFEEKALKRTKEQDDALGTQITSIFSELGKIKNTSPHSEPVQSLVKQLKNFINEHFYTCSNEILRSLGKMYSSGGDFTVSIDSVGGDGTAEFTNRAIEIFCNQ